MSTVLTAYGNNAFKQFLLPAIDNADYSVILSSEMFGMDRDIDLRLEIIDGKWFFLFDEHYQLEDADSGNSCFEKEVYDGAIIRIVANGTYVISVIIRKIEEYFSSYDHYQLQDEVVTIGSESSNTISYDYLNLISPKHAQIEKRESAIYVTDLNTENGTFVNNRRISGSIPLSFGDCVDIYGLRLVCLGDVLAVNRIQAGVVVDHKLAMAKENTSDSNSFRRIGTFTEVFHRSPRHIPLLNTETIEIEDPPQMQSFEEQSLLMTIMPAFTMAIPTVLGCVLMAYASNRQGYGSGMYMMVGMFTSVFSAVMGAVWGIYNARNAKRKHQENEEKRNQVYSEYLHECEEKIRKIYAYNSKTLEDLYRPADECCSYTHHSPELWNRNIKHADFLTERIGIGSIPSPAEIRIPKKKIAMVRDDLAGYPERLKYTYETLHNVPIVVDLLRDRFIGVVGNRRTQGGMDVILDLVAQITANNAYTDVHLVFLYNEKKDAEGEWDFTKWLPHVWNETKTFRYVASNQEEASEVCYELLKIFRERLENEEQNKNNAEPEKPYYVVFVAEESFLEGELISRYILNPEMVPGLSTVYLAEHYEELPNTCEYMIENDEDFHGIYRVTDNLEDRTEVRFDAVSPELLRRLAAHITNIEIRESSSENGDIPASLSFFDMYRIKRLTDLNILERWRKNRTYESMRALIGQKAGGSDCYLDIHEKYHGPHGLVAGTTGSGKSETLQTYILSLAVNYSPDDIGFFLIDYKGGGMANLFRNLPHTVGSISNLSGNQIHRALVSFRSEKDRRQRIFNEYGVNNINSYTRLYKNGETKIPIPHLIIVIDEFAEMKRNEPDFIKELISISQVGRSLGIHLIMATQKPSGTVDDNIWSNSRFKLCLRVQDRQDSMDMLHRQDAAYITQAGRCYLQVGNDELFELFQSGYSGAPYVQDGDEYKADVAKMLTVNGKAAVEGNLSKLRRKRQQKEEWIRLLLKMMEKVRSENGSDSLQEEETDTDKHFYQNIFDQCALQNLNYEQNDYNRRCLKNLSDLEERFGADAEKIIEEADRNGIRLPERPVLTQLDAVTEYLADEAKENHYTNDFSLYLPPLPKRIERQNLPYWKKNNGAGVFNGKKWPNHDNRDALAAEIGMFDDPENQRQDVYSIDLMDCGHIAVCGAITTGKSSFLQSLAFELMNLYSPDAINFYMIDFSAHFLAPFEEAPHVGGVMYEENADKISKFFTMLVRVLKQRKQMLQGGSYDQYVKKHKESFLPLIVVMIDNFSAFSQKTDHVYDNAIMQLLKEGAGTGISLMVTCAGMGGAELPSKMADNFKTMICLELNDPMGYGEILRKMHIEVYPETSVKGRGIAWIDGRILEFQTALPFSKENDFDRGERIKANCRSMKTMWEGEVPKPIPHIPEKPVMDDFLALEDTQVMLRSDRMLPIGYDEKFAEPYGINLAHYYSYIISGKGRSGKTNLLKDMALAAYHREEKKEIYIIDYSHELDLLADRIHANYITDNREMYEFVVHLISVFKERNAYKRKLIAEGMEEEEIFNAMCVYPRVYIFINNLADFVLKSQMHEGVGDYKGTLVNLLDRGSLHNVYWFACLNQDHCGAIAGDALYETYVRDRRGIHLGGAMDAQRLMNFDFIRYSDQSQTRKPGHAVIPTNDNESTRYVTLPLVRMKAAEM